MTIKTLDKMRKIFFFLFFSNFMFSQNYYVNKYLGLNDSLENNELRIYVSHSGNTIDYDVFIMKINKKSRTKASYYFNVYNEDVKEKHLPTIKSNEIWKEIEETHFLELDSNLSKNISKIEAFLDSGDISIYYKNNDIVKHFYIEEPNYYIKNYISVDEISKLNKFLKIIEKYYKIKFSTN